MAKSRRSAGVLKATIWRSHPTSNSEFLKREPLLFAPVPLTYCSLISDLLSYLGNLEIILVPLVSLPACVLGIFAFHVYGQNTGSWLNVQRGMTACNKTQQVSTPSPPPNISRGLSNPFATPTAIQYVLLFLNFLSLHLPFSMI